MRTESVAVCLLYWFQKSSGLVERKFGEVGGETVDEDEEDDDDEALERKVNLDEDTEETDDVLCLFAADVGGKGLEDADEIEPALGLRIGE